MKEVVLLLDIDGVLSVGACAAAALLSRCWPGFPNGVCGFPVPLARPFLQAVDRASWIKPVWLSSGWGKNATVWNEWAETSPWRMGYPLSFAQTRSVMAMYPGFLVDDMEGHKTKAALWHSGTGSRRVVWVEDGFPESALSWARMDSRVTLSEHAACERSSSNGDSTLEH